MRLAEVIGPVMIGPLSSHTAGAARLGGLARRIWGRPVTDMTIFLRGSFAATFKGHGTDLALAGIRPAIPPDEVIDAMRSVGNSLPDTLRETGMGGVAATPTGIRLKEEFSS